MATNQETWQVKMGKKAPPTLPHAAASVLIGWPNLQRTKSSKAHVGARLFTICVRVCGFVQSPALSDKMNEYELLNAACNEEELVARWMMAQKALQQSRVEVFHICATTSWQSLSTHVWFQGNLRE